MEKVVQAIQDDYAEDYSWCYGCGRLNKHGLQLRTGWLGNKTVTVYRPEPEHSAIPGIVYGGLIASIIDCHGTGSASLALHRKNGYEPGSGVEPPRFVTASLQIDFLKPTPMGMDLQAIGVVEEVHPKRFNVHTEVFAGDDCCAKGVVTAVVMPTSFR